MSRSIFGWSYPPGCSGPPDEPDYPCPICGNPPDDCTCSECPECGDIGCLTHMKSYELANLIQKLEYQIGELRTEARKREVTLPPCPEYGQVHVVTIFADYPSLCCGYEYDSKRGWEKNDFWGEQ